MANIRELVHQFLPDMKVEWFNGFTTLGCYRTRQFGNVVIDEEIVISKPMAEINSWEVIRLIVLHEIAHALTPGHSHDDVWRSKCLEIGGDGETYTAGAERAEDGTLLKINLPKPKPVEKKTRPLVYRYIKVCDKCGTLVDYGSRKTAQESHWKCGGTLQFLPNPLFNKPDYDADRIFDQMNEQLVSVLKTDKSILGTARLMDTANGVKQNHLFVICSKIPSEDERRTLYAEFEGLYEHARISSGTDQDLAESDKLTVKKYARTTDVVYVSSDDLQSYIKGVLDCKYVPDTEDYSIRNFACLEPAEMLFEKDDTWQKIKDLIHSCTKDVFRMICQSELRLAISEEILNSIANKKYADIHVLIIPEACKHLIRALYAANGRFCGKIDLEEGLKITESLEKKPEDFDKIFGSVLEKKYVKDSYPESLEKILRLSMEIDSLSRAD